MERTERNQVPRKKKNKIFLLKHDKRVISFSSSKGVEDRSAFNQLRGVKKC